MIEAPPNATPLVWLASVATALKWPTIVGFAFYAGRLANKLEARLTRAEHRLETLTTRHMPAIHKALGEIRGLVSRD